MLYFRIIMALLAAVYLAACGSYRPLYGKGPSGEGVSGALASVSVPEQHDRAGQLLRNELLTSMSSNGQQKYVLKLVLTEKTIDVSVLSASNLHRKRYSLTAQYELVETSSGTISSSGSSFSNVSYDVVRQPVADLQAANNAEQRAAGELGQDIRQRIAAYFSTKQ